MEQNGSQNFDEYLKNFDFNGLISFLDKNKNYQNIALQFDLENLGRLQYNYIV